MASGVPQYLAAFQDGSRPAVINRSDLAYHEVAGRLHREATIVGRLLANGIENNRSRRFLKDAFKHTVGFENLRAAYDHQAQYGGPAPGIDGITYEDLAEKEWWAKLREISNRCRAGRYTPNELRELQIHEGAKVRTLNIPTCIDRILERAILTVVSLLSDVSFEDSSFGFRPGRSTQDALALASVIAEEEGAYIWLKTDIRSAFDTIPHGALIALCRQKIPCDELVALIELIVRRPGTAWEQRTRGVHQGGPMSPLLLNIFLDQVLDKPWRRNEHDAWTIRFADDILLVGRTHKHVTDGLNFIRQALHEHGMTIKEEKTNEVNLRAGKTLEFLGLEAYAEQGTIQYGTTEDSWTALKQHLASNTPTDEHTSDTATQVITAWLNFAAPTCGVTRKGESDLVHETLSLLATNHIVNLWEERGKIGMLFAHRVEEWTEKLVKTRDVYRVGRQAPLTLNSKIHAAEAAAVIL